MTIPILPVAKISRRLRVRDVRAFRRAARSRGDTLVSLAARFGVSHRHLYRVLNGEVSAPLVAKITAYMQQEAA